MISMSKKKVILMQKMLAITCILLLMACAAKLNPLQKNYPFDKGSPNGFLYGKAKIKVGGSSKFTITFKNAGTGENFNYEKSWFSVPFTNKELLFAFEIPQGRWKLYNMVVGKGGGVQRMTVIDKDVEIAGGKGYYLGNFEVKEELFKIQVDMFGEPTKVTQEKGEVDEEMKNEFPGFAVENTESVK